MLRPNMLTTYGISSFDSSRKSSGDSPAKPECPAKNICPSGASPTSKCLSDLHQMKRCPSMRPNTGVQFQFRDENGTVDSGLFSLSFRAPCHLDFHSFSRRFCRFVFAWSMNGGLKRQRNLDYQSSRRSATWNLLSKINLRIFRVPSLPRDGPPKSISYANLHPSEWKGINSPMDCLYLPYRVRQ